MKKLVLVLLFIPLLGFGQDISFLDQKNGFKDIKLGTNINDYSFISLTTNAKQKFTFDMKILRGSDFYSRFERVITKTYYDSHYKYFVDEDLEEYKNYPGNSGSQRVYIGTFNNLISDITIIMNNDNHTGIINTLWKVFGFGDGNLYEWHPLWKGLQKEEAKNRRYLHTWSGQKVDLSVHSIHYVPDGTGLKYDRKIGWEVRYTHKELYKKKKEQERRNKDEENIKRAKNLLNEF
tara:strand:- start:43 stop:747 length:705 start_codon:yes stop_codon:yes gene_type:complete